MLRFLAMFLLTYGATSSGFAQDWIKFESKEGGFTIDLPAKPTINRARVRMEAGGDVKTILVGTEAEGGKYLAFQVKMPSKVVKGTENAELDAERDSLAREWNGRVTSERKIRAGKMIGRDFIVQGNPAKEVGALTIRVRQYLAEDAMFLAAVVSLPNRDLPVDSGRFLGSLTIGGVRAEGTPTPDQPGDILEGWGKAIDPFKDCEFNADKDSLKFNLTGSKHVQPGEQQSLNYPRVMKDVEGDFVISVKVVGEFKPGGMSTTPKSIPFYGAGIIIWSDPDNYIRLERAAVNRAGRVSTYVNFEEFEGGTNGATHSEAMQGGDCWVRIERTGSRIQGSISFDGTKWKELKPIQTVWPNKLKVGLVAISSSSLAFQAAFEEYQFKAKPKDD